MKTVKCPGCEKEFTTTARKLSKCPGCSKRISMKSPKHIIKETKDISSEAVEPKTKKTGTTFWDQVRSKRTEDQDIIETLATMQEPEKISDEFAKELSKTEAPMTRSETASLIGEAISLAMKQMAYMMDEENSDPVTQDEKTSVLGKAAILCLNVEITEPDTEPFKLSPITLLVAIAVVCFLPQIFSVVKNKFFKKKEAPEDDEPTSTPEEV